MCPPSSYKMFEPSAERMIERCLCWQVNWASCVRSKWTRTTSRIYHHTLESESCLFFWFRAHSLQAGSICSYHNRSDTNLKQKDAASFMSCLCPQFWFIIMFNRFEWLNEGDATTACVAKIVALLLESQHSLYTDIYCLQVKVTNSCILLYSYDRGTGRHLPYGSHSVACYPIQVNVPGLNPSQ